MLTKFILLYILLRRLQNHRTSSTELYKALSGYLYHRFAPLLLYNILLIQSLVYYSWSFPLTWMIVPVQIGWHRLI
jgi:hypothetical protein